MKKILITGSNGFVGQYLFETLSNNFEVFGIDRVQKKIDKHHLLCDITEHEKLTVLYNDIRPDIVIHLAAIVHKNNADTSEENYNYINYECSKYLFDLAVNNQAQVIYASTIEVYGDVLNQIVDENTLTNPESYYAKSKLDAEEYLQTLDISYSILRFTPLYGEKFTSNVDKRVYLKKDKIAYYFKDGSYSFDFCNIDNVCKAIGYLCEHKTNNNIYILADKESLSAKKIIATNKKNQSIMVLKLPYSLAIMGISLLDIFMRSKKDFYFSKRNFKKLFSSKHYSSKKINELIDLDYTYEGIVKR